MKKYLFLIFVVFSIGLYSQERYFSLYPGWKIYNAFENEVEYYLLGCDTINLGYSNTPIMIKTNLFGDEESVYRYINDTVNGISIYSSKSYLVYDNYITVYGAYAEYNKDYDLVPICLYLNRTDFTLDSVKSFRSYLNNTSSIIRIQQQIEDNKFVLSGSIQLSLNSDVPTFFGLYNLEDETFTYEVYNAPSNCRMTPYQVLLTDDGGYLLACEQDMTYLNPEEVFACILKLDSEGNEQWRYVIDGRMVETQFGPAESATYRPRIFNAPDGNYWVVWTDPEFSTPTIMDINPNRTVWIAKLIDNGNSCEFIEERDLRTELDNFNRGSYVIEDSYQAEDGTMYVLLTMLSEYQSALVKIHPNGVGAWFRTYKCYPEDVGSSYTYLKGMTATSDGGFMLTGGYLNHGTEMFPAGMIASVVFKVDSCGCFEEEGCNDHCMDSYSEHYVYMQEASVYPNPASDKITVSFDYKGGATEFTYKIYSLSGKAMQSGIFREPQCPLSVHDLPSGYYTIQVWGGGKIFTGKFVKE